MTLDPDICYRAFAAHDVRFDGRFYVGVRTTGIYCRPVCTVRSPRRENCRFFRSAAAAEAAGFRPCLRCRPELAPGFGSVDAASRLARAAVALIEDGFLEGRSLADLARRLGVSDRHLRRVFEHAFGVTPIAHAQTQRLLLAKRLLTDTAMPVTDVAFASGFASVRRLNALFGARYRMPPSRLRTLRAHAPGDDALRFELGFRPPYAWSAIAGFLGRRAIGGVERVEGARFRRALALVHRGATHAGWVEVTPAPRRAALVVRVAPALARVVPQVLARVRHVFDLDADPQAVAAALGPLLRTPGLRVPGTFDGFELAVRAIVGQQIAVAAATTLMTRIADRFGSPLPAGAPRGLLRTFPAPATIAGAGPTELRAVGLTGARVKALHAVARAVADERLLLAPEADLEPTLAALQVLPGIGPWTASYVAMRALAWPDAFPHTDLGVVRALGETDPRRVLARAEAWRPWRAYAVIQLWQNLAEEPA